MKSGRPKIEKWQVLDVLEDGKWKTSDRIKLELEKQFGECFGLKPTVNAVRKHMQRCSPREQRLVSLEKIGRSYYYKINDKGRKRLSIIRAKKFREFEKRLDELAKSGELTRFLGMQERGKKKWVFDRTLEIVSSLKLCDVVLSISRDKNALNLAGTAKMHWQLEYSKLIPYISEQQAKTIMHLSEQMAKAMEKLLA